MLVFFSGRRLKPGSWEQFREAWGTGVDDQEPPAGAVAIYHARNVKDENEVISFGIFDGEQGDIDFDEDAEAKRQEAMAKFVDDMPLEGVYEVIEEIKP